MTQIINLPVYGYDIQAQNNEDLRWAWAFVDDQIASVTVYAGGTAVGGAGFTGTLPATFMPPISGQGYPAVGLASVTGGILTGVAVSSPGAGYEVAESVGLSLPNAGSGVVVGINVGNPISLAGIILDFEVRPSAGDPLVVLSASTQSTINSLPTQGVLVIDNNLLGLLILESAMIKLAAGSYVYEVRANADGAVRVIAKGNFTINAGVSFERG